jgi:geranylgeranyl reductase family protein
MATTEKAIKSEEFRGLLLADIILGPTASNQFTKTYDVVIIGGGPSGAYLGYCLARQGYQPVIFDHSHPREKPCGGILSARALQKFPILETAPSIEIPDKKYRMISPENKSVLLGKEIANRTKAVSRRNLDRFLLDSAIKWGCKFVPEKVISLSQQNGLWKIKTPYRELRAAIVVGADGVKSIVRKYVTGAFERKDLAVALGYLATGYSDKATVKKFLRNRNGHLWVSNRGNHCCVGISDSVVTASNLKSELDEFLKKESLQLKTFSRWSALRPQASSTELFNKSCSGKNWLLIGDAAGHVNPLTGEGILYALWSAEIASFAIKTGDLRLYESSWKDEYGKELSNAAKKRKFFFNSNNIENAFQFAHKSSTFSEILYEVVEGEEEILKAGGKILLKSPKILLEMMLN